MNKVWKISINLVMQLITTPTSLADNWGFFFVFFFNELLNLHLLLIPWKIKYVNKIWKISINLVMQLITTPTSLADNWGFFFVFFFNELLNLHLLLIPWKINYVNKIWKISINLVTQLLTTPTSLADNCFFCLFFFVFFLFFLRTIVVNRRVFVVFFLGSIFFPCRTMHLGI